MIEEANPLHISKDVSVTKSAFKNTRGRPSKKSSIKYTDPPKSIISQLLTKMRQENTVSLSVSNLEKCDTVEIIDYLDSDDDSKNDNIVTREPTKEIKCVEEPHKETSPKTYYCDYHNCKYSSKISSNITKHKRIHTNEKPYVCDRCSFRTNFINSLKTHSRLHTEERPYQCQHCAYKCNSVSNLKKHSHNRHKNKKE